MGIEIEDRPFAKSTLQLFRAQLILHEKVREVFESSLRLARQSGYLKKRGMRVALDTTYILGRGAVQDTYNLLADGIVKLLRVLAAVANIAVGEWAEGQGYEKYFGSSIKGEATIDWSDRKARAALLAELVADADRLLELARQAWLELPEDGAQRQSIVAGAELLGQLLLQDIERKSGDVDAHAHADAAADGVSIRDGVSKDRMLSVHDPELRHGHKSSRRRFNGHKAAIVVDTDSQLITAVEVLPGNAPDNLGALELVEQSEASTGSVVEEAMGDAAYGDGGTRQTFADAGRRLVAKAPGRPDRKHFPKNDFHLDLAAGSCTCPAGQATGVIVPAGKRTDGAGRVYRLQAFQFDGAVCGVCPLRSQCIAAQGRQGRRVLIHPQEGMLQQARALQQSADYDEYRARRVVVEHRLARLVQLGIRQARYFGRVKTKFQLYLAATVANLTLVAGKIGLLGSIGGGAAGHRVVRNDVRAVVANAAANFSAVRLGQLWSLILLTSALLPKSLYPTRVSGPLSRRRRLHARIVNVRNDNHHKATTGIARSSGRVVVETLNVSGMLHNRRLAQAIADAGMSGFLTKLGHKCAWYGAECVKADRWFASSKLCAHCGWKNEDLTLSEREWWCGGCGALNERDHNAGVNLSNWPGLSFPVSGRGDCVSSAMPAVVGEASNETVLEVRCPAEAVYQILNSDDRVIQLKRMVVS